MLKIHVMITVDDVVNGLSIQDKYLPIASEYLQAFYNTMHKALSDYPRVLAIRIDPVTPTEISDKNDARRPSRPYRKVHRLF